MKRFILLMAAMISAASTFAAPRVYELKSPDGKLSVAVEAGEGLSYTLSHDGQVSSGNAP